jgi:hypothetical protein
LVVGGAMPHNFYKLLDFMVKGKKLHGKLFRFLIERLVFTPVYLVLRLYLTSIFEVHTYLVKNNEKKKLKFICRASLIKLPANKCTKAIKLS